jgi:hypothetical protein
MVYGVIEYCMYRLMEFSLSNSPVLKAYRDHIATNTDEDPSKLDETIELFSNKHEIH